MLAFLTFFGVVNFSDAFLILRAKALGLGFVAIICAYVLYNLTYAGLSYPAGRLSDRVPRRVVFAAGLAVFATAYLGLGLVTTSGWVWPLLAVYGAFTALTDGVGKAWITDLLPPDRHGSGLGLYQGVIGAGSLVAGVWAGLAWHGNGRIPLAHLRNRRRGTRDRAPRRRKATRTARLGRPLAAHTPAAVRRCDQRPWNFPSSISSLA